jgi:hypothetical protein
LRFLQISTGAQHTCGLAVNARVYCWGTNGNGELGNGGTNSSFTPTAIASSLRFSQVDVGQLTTCALAEAGDAYCWGLNWDAPTVRVVRVPTLIPGGLTFRQVRAGLRSGCGITTTGQAYCWGARGFASQLGDGVHGTNSFTTVPVPVAVQPGFTQLAAGSGGHACGETVSNQLYCWGEGTFGQLGNGSRTHSSMPVRVNELRAATGGPSGLVPTAPPGTRWTAGATLPPPGTTQREMRIPTVGVQVLGSSGLSVSGVPVQFSVVSGGATIIGASTVFSDGAGVARLSVRLGPSPGLNVIRATVASLPPLELQIEGVTPGPASRLLCFFFCFDQLTPGSTAVTVGRVTALDSASLPVAGAQVRFSPVRSMGSSTPPMPFVATTDVDGTAGPTSFTADNVARRDTLATATLVNSPQAQVILTLSVVGEPPVSVGLNSLPGPIAARAGEPIPFLSVVARDRFGTLSLVPVAITVEVASGPPGATLTGTTTVTTVNGVASFANARLSPAGTGYSLRFTSPGLTSATTGPFTIVP